MNEIYNIMKTPERWLTSRVPHMHSRFAQKSFCHDGHRHTHTYITSGLAVRVFTDRHTDTQTDSSDSMTSIADAGGKYEVLIKQVRVQKTLWLRNWKCFVFSILYLHCKHFGLIKVNRRLINIGVLISVVQYCMPHSICQCIIGSWLNNIDKHSGVWSTSINLCLTLINFD